MEGGVPVLAFMVAVTELVCVFCPIVTGKLNTAMPVPCVPIGHFLHSVFEVMSLASEYTVY